MEIKKEIIESAKKCEYNFECLSNKNCFCLSSIVNNIIYDKALFIKCNENSCGYNIIFGQSTICTCPVRSEIFKKYKQ
jgi:hypothetical protein